MDYKRLDRARRSVGPVQLDVIESYAQGKISRRDFLKRGAIVGLSMPLMGSVLAACGGDDDGGATTTAGGGAPETTAGGATGQPVEGGTMRWSMQTPSTSLDPVLMQDLSSYGIVSQSMEFLVGLGLDGNITPALATSWEPNDDGSVWTFTLREGVTFHDGTPFTSAAVAATMDRLAEAGNSALQGVLSQGGVETPDDLTAIFNLDIPNGNLPFLVSLFNAQSPITPVDYEVGTALDQVQAGTGPFILDSYDPATGATFRRNENWWGGVPPLETVEFVFFDNLGAQITALQSGTVDGLVQFQVIGADALFDNPDFKVLGIQAANHRQVWMRTDTGQFTDKRVRQALALTFDREAMINTLWRGRADIGNDHVIAPFLPFFDEDAVPQRERNPEQARQLLADAGFPDGLSAVLHCGEVQEIPDLAQIIQAGAAEGGFNLEVQVEGLDTFYGNQWCPPEPADPPCSGASELGIVDYGHRPTPDVYLNAALSTGGVWNSSQYANPSFDSAFVDYQAAIGVDAQKSAVGEIQRILNDEVPIGLPYFYNYLAGHTTQFDNAIVSALGHPVLGQATRVG